MMTEDEIRRAAAIALLAMFQLRQERVFFPIPEADAWKRIEELTIQYEGKPVPSVADEFKKITGEYA